jgi:perosamine synthetase
MTPQRSALQAHLRSAGIETLVHYPVPISRQPAFAASHPADCPHANRVADEVLSLPLYPGLSIADVRAVADAVRSFAPRAGKELAS